MTKVIPGPDLTGRGRDGIPLPRSGLHHWWLRHGLVLCAGGLSLSLALMSAGTYLEVTGRPHGVHYQRWGLWIALANLLAYFDILTQRVIRRLTDEFTSSLQAVRQPDCSIMTYESNNADQSAPSVGHVHNTKVETE